jgi:hypothetical protein
MLSHVCAIEEDQPMYFDKADALRPIVHEPRRAAARRERRVQMSFAGEASPTLRASTSTSVRRSVPRASLGVSLPPFPIPTHKPANRGLIIWSAALFSGLCVLGALAFYLTASGSVSVTAGSTRGVMPLADAPAARSNGAIMPLAVPPSARSNDESNAIDLAGLRQTRWPAFNRFCPRRKISNGREQA